MTEFDFTASAECSRCGNWLSSSNDDCDSCEGETLRRFHFDNITTNETEVVWAISPKRAWVSLSETVDDVRPYELRQSNMTSLEFAQVGVDVTDEDELRRT